MGPFTRRGSGTLIHLPLPGQSQHHPDIIPSPKPTMAFEGSDLLWPFANLLRVDADDLREVAHEIFFTSCRSSPGFGGRNALAYYSSSFDATNDATTGGGGGGGSWAGQGSSSSSSSVNNNNNNNNNSVSNSKVKRALGLRMLRKSKSRRANSIIGNEFSCSSPKSPNSNGNASPGRNAFNTMQPPSAAARAKRRLTLAEIMRQQMRIPEQGDNRLRKTLVRTLVGQTGRKPETIILPLELLRHLKPSEFAEPHEYHMWQLRQFHLLECGLLLYPSIYLDKNSSAAVRLRELVRSVDENPLDTTAKNSEAMRSLCNSVLSLSWRSASSDNSSAASESCHWADGYPFNIHIYVTLLRSIFDLQDETALIDEVDESLELMKKTWTTLAISRPIHNLCFAWVLFERYVEAGGGGGPEAELLGATLMMMNEVMGDAKRVAVERDAVYLKILGPTMAAIKRWSEKRLGDYHRYYRRGTIGVMENILPLVSAVTKILEEDVPVMPPSPSPEKSLSVMVVDSTGNKVDKYIRSSLRNAFSQLLETQNITSAIFQEQEVNDALLKLAKETEELALREKEIFSPILKKWHPIAAGSAAVSLHTCYGTLLKQYVVGIPTLTADTLKALQSAGKLEKLLVQMVVEDSVDCEDGGKAIVREMVPYEVDGIIIGLLKEWIHERMKTGRECILRAKEIEAWKPMSKNEAYAQSAVELIKMAKEAIGDFFDLPLAITEDLLMNFAEGLGHLFHDYISFLGSCGSKQSYIPNPPPLTRCSRGSRIVKFWKKTSPCSAIMPGELAIYGTTEDGQQIRSSTSRGTQRLYIRLNTLHYLLSQIQLLDKSLSLSSRIIPSPTTQRRRRGGGLGSSYFETVEASIRTAIIHVSEVAAYRLIFLDSSSFLYDTLYVGNVATTRIKPALKTLKQNLTLLCLIVTDSAQKMAVKDMMRASFEAFVVVLVAGGGSRVFKRQDHAMIVEDLNGLKNIFATCGDRLVTEDDLEREAEAVEGVAAMMGDSTEQLIDDFSIISCEASGTNAVRSGGRSQKLPMPATTGKWSRSDANTILRVLCHRKDRAANNFLKRTFQLARRR